MGSSTFVFIPSTWKEAVRMVKTGKIAVIVEEEGDSIRYHFDPLNPESQLTYIQLSGIFKNPDIKTNPDVAAIEPLDVKGTRYIDFLIPGLIAMNVMMSCMWGISYTMINRRSRKLLRRMVATPMKKSNFMIAITTARLALNIVEAVILIVFANLYFDITIQGSLPALILIYIAGNILFSGLGILISSRTSNTEIGNGLINAITMPMMVLSGIFFSYHNFPDWAIAIIKKLPLSMMADGIRSIFIEGAGLTEVIIPALALAGGGFLLMGIGVRVYRWY